MAYKFFNLQTRSVIKSMCELILGRQAVKDLSLQLFQPRKQKINQRK